MDSHLTDDEKHRFFEDGFLVIENALSSELQNDLILAFEKHFDSEVECYVNEANILGRDPVFIELIDLPTVFPKVFGLLGANIWVNHCHCNVNPPEKATTKTFYGWHRDGGAVHTDLRGRVPLMSIKCAFYLTDLSTPGSGQTYVIPGSHHADGEEWLTNGFAKPDSRCLALNLKPGSALIFHQRLIHSSHSPNTSGRTRKAVFIQWAYRWLSAVDSMQVSHLDGVIKDPVRRQLLGLQGSDARVFDPEMYPFAGQNRSSRYYPSSVDLPLLEKLPIGSQPTNVKLWDD